LIRHLRVNSHREACILDNALREHYQTFPYYNKTPLSQDQQDAANECRMLLQQSKDLLEEFERDFDSTDVVQD
jgi:hypothetical protein